MAVADELIKKNETNYVETRHVLRVLYLFAERNHMR